MTLNQLKIIGAIIVLLLIGFIVEWIVLRKESPTPPQQEINFKQNGQLVRNNPGMKLDAWYLIYEQPGAAALSRELKFNDKSSCRIGDQVQDCAQLNFLNGLRVYIEGYDENGVVTVATLMATSENNLIHVSSPLANQIVKSPLTITGEAKGNWYFEATFPIKLYDFNGNILAQTQGHAQDNWMTDDFVPFTAQLTFTTPMQDTGSLVLEKDNPSGLPQNSASIVIPIKFEVANRDIKLYYYDLLKDKDSSGNILCSRNGLVAVNRQIPVTNTPIQDTIKFLLLGQLTAAQKAQAGFISISANVQGYCWEVTGPADFSGCNDLSGSVPDGTYSVTLRNAPSGYELSGFCCANPDNAGEINWSATFSPIASAPPPAPTPTPTPSPTPSPSPGAPSVTSFYSSPNPVSYGGSATLYWSSSNTTNCTSPQLGNGNASGSTNVGPLY